MTIMEEISTLYERTRELGFSGIAQFSEGAMKILRVMNENPNGEILLKGSTFSKNLLEQVLFVDFAFRLLHPIGLFLASEANDAVSATFFPEFLIIYERAGKNGVRTADADYSINLQTYLVHLAQRSCTITDHVLRLVNEAVDSSFGFSIASGFRPPLLDSFIDARAKIKNQIDTGALKPSLPLDEESWKELLVRR